MESGVFERMAAERVRQGEGRGIKDSVEGAERKGGGISGTEEQGRVGMAEKLKESEERRRKRNRGIRE